MGKNLPQELERLQKQAAKAQAHAQALEDEVRHPDYRDFAQGVLKEAPHQAINASRNQENFQVPGNWFLEAACILGRACWAHDNAQHDQAQEFMVQAAALINRWHRHTGEEQEYINRQKEYALKRMKT